MKREFDYIITDYNMPGMDGIELTRRLSELFSRAIIIGISGEDQGMAFLEAGANGFLAKARRLYQLVMMLDGDDILE
jgi:CheY-like chemotaxis protein